ncbi:MAG: TolC family protein, partial [Desulfamplus sp.]|nr:TolC family protein [Desulfamplus sp.]
APMARAVIGGLITSTLLTLLVVPVMYTILDDISGWFSRSRKNEIKQHDAGKDETKQNSAKRYIVSIILTIVSFSILYCDYADAGNSNLNVGVGKSNLNTGASLTLTLEQALSLAALKNKDIKMAQEYRKRVEGIYIEERSAALPKIGFTGTAQYGRDETQRAYSDTSALSNHSYGGAITLKQPLYTWGQIGAAIRAAKIGILTSDDQLKLHRQAVARDVSTAFYDLLLAIELQHIAKKNLELKMRHLDESKRKYSAGTATDYDVLSAEVALKNARPEVIQYENLERVLKERLGILIGIADDENTKDGAVKNIAISNQVTWINFQIIGSLDITIKPLQEINQAVQTAWNNRAELSELDHQLGMRQELIKVVNAADKPRVDLQASYGWQDLFVDDKDEFGNTISTAVVFSYPFFDGMNTRGRLDQAQSEVRNLMLQKEKLKDSIRLEVFESLSRLRESGEIVNALVGTVTQAEELSAMAEKGFIYGVKTHLDVQDSQLAVKQAKGNLAKAKRDYLVTEITLKWVLGELY